MAAASAHPRMPVDARSWRRQLAVVGFCLLAVLTGVLAATKPSLGFALIALVAIFAMAWRAPVAHLCALLFLTAIVPYTIQNRFGVAGGEGVPSVLLSDAFLIAGLSRAVVLLVYQRLAPRVALVALAMFVFVGIVFAEFLHAAALGRSLSEAGAEFRVLFGFSTALIVVTLPPGSHRRLFHGFLVLGLVLGLWGLAQWTLNLPLREGDFGIRPGSSFTNTSGQGSLQGGLFGFPVAILMAFAALLMGRGLTTRVRLVLGAILLLNSLCLMLTYERTFYVATVIGGLFLVVKSGSAGRMRALVWAPIILVITFLLLSTFAPTSLPAARERVLSLGQYSSDKSVRYRITETQHVLAKIREHPIQGSGLAATVFWGRPYDRVPPQTFSFDHNGYLWLVWKLGLVGAVLLVGLLVLLVSRRVRRLEPGLAIAAAGSQAALLVLLIANTTIPSVESLSITSAMGVCAGLCARND